METRKIAATAAVALVLTLSACAGEVESGETEGQEEVGTSPDPTNGGEAPEEGEAVEADEADSEGTRDNPVPVGEEGRVGDYLLTFSETDPDATEALIQAEADELYDGDLTYANEIGEGNVYASAPITISYTGDDSGEPAVDLMVAFVTDDGNTFDAPAFVWTENDLEDLSTLYPDASSDVTVVREVPDGAADGGTWRIQDWLSAEGAETFFATN